MHPVDILKEEHKHILKNIDELEEILNKTREARDFNRIKSELKKLEHVAHIFMEAESHHKREEDALFPELEKKGVEGPPSVMRMEHEELRKRKKEIAKLVEKSKDLKIFSSALEENGSFIIQVLREHIDKENNILYEIAKQCLSQSEWKEIAKKFNKIGYCCFSPKGGATV